MLETLHQVPFFLNRHREAPLLKERDVFLSHLQQQGTSRGALLSLSNELLHVIRLLRLDKVGDVSLAEIRRAADRFVREEQSNPRARSYRHTGSFFIYRFHSLNNSISSRDICVRSRDFRRTRLTRTARRHRCSCVGSGGGVGRWQR